MLVCARGGLGAGDVMYLSMFGSPFVVLSSRAAIGALLDRRGALYSDRPRIPMVGDLYDPPPSSSPKPER